MYVTWLTYLGGFVVLVTSLFLFFKGRLSINSNLIAIYCVSGFFTALFFGLGYDLGNLGYLTASTWIIRLAAAFSYCMFLMTLRIGITFPFEAKRRVLNILFFIIWLIIAGVIVATDHYLIGIDLQNGIFHRIEGDWYQYFSLIGITIVISAIIVMLGRSKKFPNQIHKLQITLVVIGTAISMLITFLFAIILPSFFGIYNLYPLSGFTGVIMAGSFFYAIITYRMFDIQTAIHKTVVFIVFSSMIGVMAMGAYLGGEFLLVNIPLIMKVTAYFIVFLILFVIRGRIQDYLRKVFKRKIEYHDDLISSLDKIDFSQGKQEVILKLKSIIHENIGTSFLTVIAQNNVSQLEEIFSSDPSRNFYLDSDNSIYSFLVTHNINIVMESEIHTDQRLKKHRTEFITLFHRLNIQVLIVFKESNQIIGMMGLGPKESTKEYNSYDYQTLSMCFNKLFVVMYFIRNINKQSIVTTVEKELEFSEQIIQSILKNIEKIDSEKIECYSINRFTTGLGGDFFDIIKLSEFKSLIVVGDIAGKGINASMSMVILKSIIRTMIKETPDFKALVARINLFIKTNLPRGTFFAGIFLIYDSRQDIIYFINCGIPLVLFKNENNTVSEVQGKGRVLGFKKEYEEYIQIRKIIMKKGDCMVITTDGILESESIAGEPYGKKRIMEFMENNTGNQVDAMVDSLYQSFYDFIGGLIKDDITLVGIKYKL